MSRIARAFAFAALTGAVLMPLPASAAPGLCSQFITRFNRALGDMKAEFVRPVMVSRSQAQEGGEVFDLITQGKVDGLLRCSNDRFVRFEAKVASTNDVQRRDAFYRVQEAAIIAGFQHDRGKASSILHLLSAEASEYLRASQERGDHVLAGKTENHQRGGDIGIMWTPDEREFVIVVD